MPLDVGKAHRTAKTQCIITLLEAIRGKSGIANVTCQVQVIGFNLPKVETC